MGFKTCTPNQALVVSGACISAKKNKNIIVGGKKWVWPIIQKYSKLCLNTMSLEIQSINVNTLKGVPISCIGVAQFKIAGQDSMDLLQKAAQNFLGKRPDQIQFLARETMEGHQRAIIGEMEVIQILRDRKKFASKVMQVALEDFKALGLVLVSYTLKDISDNNDYLRSIGIGKTSEVKSRARIGQAQAKMRSEIEQSKAHKERMQKKFANDLIVAESKRNMDLVVANNYQKIHTEKAIAELAQKLQEAKTKQEVKNAEMAVKVAERKRQIEIQEQEILRRAKELEANVKKPAEAEKYRMEVAAEAARQRLVLEAEAEAELIKLRGEAQAYAINEKAKAEAEQMRKKAEAWKHYKDAAIVDMVLETLPKVALEIASPIANARKITMVATGNGDIGAGKLTGEILDVVAKLPTVIENMTGVKLAQT
ncbi:Oidioi.mRNA.OKI2018_I69.PAR.g9261.t1.cds [Oikopleura dioica]|uniref:Flotillin n=1 Tax=Oikopleura dioica TaxID=34765 RepID=A0ABN7RP07_OIKDI|nr:Oidioi.mRNA.OKI2018_I69.PAR.g9261.t1.cds [Oikopleura dioica]